METITTKKLAAFLATPLPTVYDWRRQGLLDPEGGRHGQGYEWRWPEVLRAYVLKVLKAPPLTLQGEECMRIMEDMRKVDAAELEGKVLRICPGGDVLAFPPGGVVTVISRGGRGVLLPVDELRDTFVDFVEAIGGQGRGG